MDPFVHCIHYYKAVIHFFRNNIKKIYQMHFLFFCKANQTIHEFSIRFFFSMIFYDKFMFIFFTHTHGKQVHRLENDHQFKMDSVQMIQLKLQRQKQQRNLVIRQRQSRLCCVSYFSSSSLFFFAIFFW